MNKIKNKYLHKIMNNYHLYCLKFFKFQKIGGNNPMKNLTIIIPFDFTFNKYMYFLVYIKIDEPLVFIFL